MFKVLIVDDEQIICMGLRQTVPWQKIGAKVIGEAYDGEEALGMIERMDIDLVISDVKMPIMDGLELAEHIEARHPHIRMIIISGYDEFNYAKRALQFKVSDYLLKPVDIDELLETVKKVKIEKKQEKQREWHYSMNQVLITLAMEQELENKEFDKRCLNKGYRLIGSEMEDYAATILHLPDKEKSKIKKQWNLQLEKELLARGIHGTSVFISKNRLITCCNLIESDAQTMSILNEIVLAIHKNLGHKLKFCFSSYSASARELPDQYELLIKSMRAHPFQQEAVYNTEELDLTIMKKEIPAFFEHQFKNMDKLDEDDLIRFTKSLFQYFQENAWYIEEIIIYLKTFEEKFFIELKDVVQLQMLHRVNADVYNSYNQMELLFLADLRAFFTYRNKLDQGRQQLLAKQAVTYMKEHFSSDLKATEVADVINVSANYFSQLIKHETGQHFNDYLHFIRINHAKTLLQETPYRIFEIADMVGYKDYKYFVHIFKKTTNITPTQYRNMGMKNVVINGE